jgi:DNA polymerase-1
MDWAEDDVPTSETSAADAGDKGHEVQSDPTDVGSIGHGVAGSVGKGESNLLGHVPADNAATPLAGKTVWVVDANSLIFQVFHAIAEMTSPRGQPVNAVYGFTRDMLFLLEQKRPDYLLCAFDLAGPTFRHELYPAYKEQRAETPIDLAPQFAIIQRLLPALGIPVLTAEGFEADDILATVARITEEQGGHCYVVTGDKDCRQLISDHVSVYNVRKNESMDAAGLAAEWGVRPDQVVDFQSLVGDAVDNVPGVPLIGPKIARELLTRFDTLDALLARLDELPKGKRRDNLAAGGEQARLSRDLVRLDRNIPIQIDWPAARAGRLDVPALLAMFAELGFRGFADKVRALAGRSNVSLVAASPASPISASPTITAAPSDHPALASPIAEVPPPPAPPPPAPPVDYRLVTTPEALAQFVAEASTQERLSIDTETTHIWPSWADLVGLSFSWQDAHGYYIPVRCPPGESCLEQQVVLDALRPLLEDASIEKIGQNLKYDLILLRAAGIETRGVSFDTMIASYLLEAGERNHNLDELAQRHLSHTTTKITELIGTGANQKRMDEVPLPQICHYAAEDADIPWRLTPMLAQRLAANGLTELFQTVEMPLVDVLVEMESNGIRVDVQRLAALSAQFGLQMQSLEGEIFALAGHPFNIASPKQLQQVLFTELGLPVGKKTKTGASTDADVLDELARRHPLPAKILEYRQYAKLKGTYVDALPAMVNPRTGRVHASFNQVVAATGRLSCNDPNLQNIPVRNEAGREIRSAFLPDPDDWLLLAADYSQIELRVLAHFSGDETLCAAFQRDEDIHALVASQVNDVAQADVTGEMRRQAKAVNFGVIYGQSSFGLARQLDIAKEDAQAFIDQYFGRYPGVERFLTKILAECEANGYVRTILGRRRAVLGVRAGASRVRNLPERTAINTVIQGSAADLIKLAMLAVHRRLRAERRRSRLLLQVHDELILEVPP